MNEKTYLVRNPRGIDKGIVILSWRPADKPDKSQDWYEGDDFVKPPGMDDESVTEWIELGFIEEV